MTHSTRPALALPALFAAALLSIGGCARSHELGDGGGCPPGAHCIEDAGIPGDGGTGRDAGPGSVCGGTVCATGSVCCNHGCGPLTCIPEGTTCIQYPCPPPLDAGPPPPPPPPPPDMGCGGFVGSSCPPGYFCDYAPGAYCGAADAPGMCRPRPESCPRINSPVCGCDGLTYENACVANQDGQGVLHDGPCALPPDCRMTGCPTGAYCTNCGVPGGPWICLPDSEGCAVSGGGSGGGPIDAGI